jgi:hypothetical protein
LSHGFFIGATRGHGKTVAEEKSSLFDKGEYDKGLAGGGRDFIIF